MSPSSQPKWVPLDSAKLERHERSETDGIKVHVFMSPYDIPEAVRGRFDASIGRFLIEFKYLDEEKLFREAHGKHIVLRLGKNSKRLFGLEIDVESLKKAGQVGVRVFGPGLVESVREAIGALARSQQLRPSRLQNYEVAEEVIADRSSELFRELVEA